MSFGTPDVFGDIVNVDTGTIIVSGNSNVTFYDDVVNDGELRTSADTAAVFFGDVSGSGTYTGTGTVFFEGSFSPGSSPGEVAFGGDVEFGSSSQLNIELGGTTPGTEFDRLDIAGNATLAGTLNVSLFGSFTLGVGDVFEFIDVDGTLSGMFAGLAEGALVGNFGGVDLFIDYATGDGNDIALFTGTGVDVDLDNDGDVDGADFLAIQRTNPALIPDWELQYPGAPGAGLAASQAVPEPTTLTLAFLAITALTGRAKRQN